MQTRGLRPGAGGNASFRCHLVEKDKVASSCTVSTSLSQHASCLQIDGQSTVFSELGTTPSPSVVHSISDFSNVARNNRKPSPRPCPSGIWAPG